MGAPNYLPADDTLAPEQVRLQILRLLQGGAGGSGGGLPVVVTPTQYATSSNATAGTTTQTVFTLAANEVGYIQNLAAAALYVKLGASGSTSSFNLILPACGVANDGTSPLLRIPDWIGAVSVIAASGTARYIAYKLSA